MTQDPGRTSCNYGVGRNILRYNRAGSHQSAFADHHIGENDGAGADRCSRLDECPLDLPVFFRLQLPRRRGTRERVVDEHDAMADENLVLDRDTLADEGVTRDLAPPADGGVLLHFHERTDFRVVADLTAVEIDELRELYALPEFHVGRHAHECFV